MQTIILQTRIDENHQIILDVPQNLPIGEVEVELVIKPIGSIEPSREIIQARLREAGLLVEITDDDPEWRELAAVEMPSEAELERIGKLLAQGPSLQELIDEERGDY